MDSFPPKLELKNRNSPFRDRMFRRPVVLCVSGVHRNLNSPIVGSAQVEFSYSTKKEYTGSLETYDVADVAAKVCGRLNSTRKLPTMDASVVN